MHMLVEFVLLVLLATGLAGGVFWAYRRGLKDGLALRGDVKPNTVIEPVRNPIEAIAAAVASGGGPPNLERLMEDGLANILAYDENVGAKK
jgi:hypothetical protein